MTVTGTPEAAVQAEPSDQLSRVWYCKRSRDKSYAGDRKHMHSVLTLYTHPLHGKDVLLTRSTPVPNDHRGYPWYGLTLQETDGLAASEQSHGP